MSFSGSSALRVQVCRHSRPNEKPLPSLISCLMSLVCGSSCYNNNDDDDDDDDDDDGDDDDDDDLYIVYIIMYTLYIHTHTQAHI